MGKSGLCCWLSIRCIALAGRLKKTLFSLLSESIKLFLIKPTSYVLFLSLPQEFTAITAFVSNVKICLQTVADVIRGKFGKNKTLLVFLF